MQCNAMQCNAMYVCIYVYVYIYWESEVVSPIMFWYLILKWVFQWWRHTGSGFGIAILCSGSCSSLEPKGRVDVPFGCGSLRAELCWSVQCSVAYTLFAPPTHGQLCRPRAKECPLNWSTTSAAVHLLNYGELKSVQNFISTWRLATISTKKMKVLFTCM